MAAATATFADGLNAALARIPRGLVYGLGLVPAVFYFWLGVNDQLGADPAKTLERELGEWSLRFIIAGLVVSPLRALTGINLLRFRRAIGLLAFYYALFHLITYVVLDQALDWGAIWADIVKRPYITIGMASFALLVPLAISSNNASIRRLGGQAWSRLHKLVYVAAAGAALHYLLLVKSWPTEPIVYAAIVALLLLYRAVWGTKPAKQRTRQRPERPRAAEGVGEGASP